MGLEPTTHCLLGRCFTTTCTCDYRYTRKTACTCAYVDYMHIPLAFTKLFNHSCIHVHVCRDTHMQPTVMFTPVQYTLATEEAERVGVDHIARSSVTGSAQTSAGMYSDPFPSLPLSPPPLPSLLLPPPFPSLSHKSLSSFLPHVFLCTVAEQLSAQHGAVKMLHSRMRLLLDYLKAVQAGKRFVILCSVFNTLVCFF